MINIEIVATRIVSTWYQMGQDVSVFKLQQKGKHAD